MIRRPVRVPRLHVLRLTFASSTVGAHTESSAFILGSKRSWCPFRCLVTAALPNLPLRDRCPRVTRKFAQVLPDARRMQAWIRPDLDRPPL